MIAVIADAQASHLSAVRAIYAHWVIHGHASFEEIPPRHSGNGSATPGSARAGPLLHRRHGRDTSPGFRLSQAIPDTPRLSLYGGGFGLCCPANAGPRHRPDTAEGGDPARPRRGVAPNGGCDRESGNAASIHLHESLGFRKIGVLQSVGFKHGRWVDSVLMQRALDESDDTAPPESKLLRSGAA